MTFYRELPDGVGEPLLFNELTGPLERPQPSPNNALNVFGAMPRGQANVLVDESLNTLLRQQGYRIDFNPAVVQAALVDALNIAGQNTRAQTMLAKALKTLPLNSEAKAATGERLPNMTWALLNPRDVGVEVARQYVGNTASAGVFVRSLNSDVQNVPFVGFWPDPERDIAKARAMGLAPENASDAMHLTGYYTNRIGRAAVFAVSSIARENRAKAFGGSLGLRLEQISESSTVIAPAAFATCAILTVLGHTTGSNLQWAFDAGEFASGGLAGASFVAAIASRYYADRIVVSAPLFNAREYQTHVYNNLAQAERAGQPLITVTNQNL
jgi:hypothetical protein